MTRRDLRTISAWARSVCLRDFGPEVGERIFRALPAMSVLAAWPYRTLILA